MRLKHYVCNPHLALSVSLNNKTLKNEIETDFNAVYSEPFFSPLNNKTLKNEIETNGIGAIASNLISPLNNKTLKNEIETV